MTTLLWLQTGSCGGDTMSILCADSPSLEELVMLPGRPFCRSAETPLQKRFFSDKSLNNFYNLRAGHARDGSL